MIYLVIIWHAGQILRLEKCPIVVLDKPALADKARQLKIEHPEMTQEAIAKAVGCSQSNVSQAKNIRKVSESDIKLIMPAHLKSRNDQADFRKLSADLQSQVIARSISLNRASPAATAENASGLLFCSAASSSTTERDAPDASAIFPAVELAFFCCLSRSGSGGPDFRAA